MLYELWVKQISANLVDPKFAQAFQVYFVTILMKRRLDNRPKNSQIFYFVEEL